MSDSKPKPNWASKTNWLNGSAFLVGLLTILIEKAQEGALPTSLLPYGAVIVAVGNLILRQLTNKPVKPILPIFAKNKANLIAFLAVGLCCSSLLAAPPKATITGPTGGVPGDLLVLDASESDAEHFEWKVTPELPDGRKTILVLEDGKKCLITSVPGTYTAFLAVGNGEGVAMQKWTVTVGDQPGPPTPTPPNPNPGPSPNPPQPNPPSPSPDVPDGKYGISKLVMLWAKETNATNRAADCQALADAADSVASAISAGTLKGPREILAALRDANLSAVSNPEEWRPFGKKFEGRIKELFESARLLTDANWATLLRETAIGYRAAI